ncbi:MAG TPA: hypothetical protein VHO06_09415, partial [Polyangia bacterium]|nr:hypothetical protein [Polyangia bacterium]
SPVEIEFRTAGRLFVLAGTDWDGGAEVARTLEAIGRREPIPPLVTEVGTGFSVFSVTGRPGDRLLLPTQAMLVAARLTRLDRAPSPAAGRPDVLVIAGRPGCGTFSNFFQVLGQLRWAEQRGLAPVVYFNRVVCSWSEAGLHGARNAWDYLFRPVSFVTMADLVPDPRALEGLDAKAIAAALGGRAVVRDDYLGEDVGVAGRIDTRQRAIAAGLAARHVRVRPELLARAEKLHRRYLGGHFVVGVHQRGTDKVHEAAPVPFERYRYEIDRLLAAEPQARIFAATDDAGFLAALEHVYGARVVSTPSRRSRDGRPTHFGYPEGATEALIDVLLLAWSDHLVHGVSNVSAAVLVLNERLPHTDLSVNR